MTEWASSGGGGGDDECLIIKKKSTFLFIFLFHYLNYFVGKNNCPVVDFLQKNQHNHFFLVRKKA